MISLCMIVKDEEKYLRACLESVKNVAGEIILVDTGSKDNTIKIAEEYNARIFNFTWTGDFSAARNFSLQQAAGDWVLYLDADERLSKDSVAEIKRITSEKKKTGYNCLVSSVDEFKNHPSVMSYVRLFPADEKIRFIGKVHEQIEPALIKNKFSIRNSSIEIIHLGYSISSDGIQKKAERNLVLLLNEYNESHQPYYAFQLGQTLGILNRKDEAEKYFEIALKDSTLRKEYRGLAYRYLAINFAERKDFGKSLELIEKSLAEDDQQPLSLMAASKIFTRFKMNKKASESAIKAYEVNNKFIDKKLSSSQNILMDEKELCHHGLEVAVSILDKELFNFFYRKINDNNSNIEMSVFNDLYNNVEIEEGRIAAFTKSINEQQLDSLLSLLERYTYNSSRVSILLGLAEKYKKNPYIHLHLGKFYSLTGNFISAEDELEESIRLLPDEPSFYFYLVSVYLQNSNLKKLVPVLDVIETRFSSQPGIISRLGVLKQMIAKHIN